MKKLGFLGVDVSKGMSNFMLYNHLGTVIEDNFQLDDNRSGHKQLYEMISKWNKDHKFDKIIVGVESTGGYENNWYEGMRRRSKQLSLAVFRINPKRIYHEAKTEGRRSITDGVSARVIGGYLRKNYGEFDLEEKRLEQSAEWKNIRTLHKYIQRLIGQNTRTKNALEKLLYSFLPELLSEKPEKYTNWFLELIIKYPSRESILKAGKKRLTKIKYLHESKAEAILTALKSSIGTTADPYTTMAIQEQGSDIKQLTEKITRLKKQLIELATPKLSKQLELIKSIKGISDDTAIGILIEIENIERYEKASSLVGFWGINPTYKESGDKHFKVGMSKDGSPSARAIMYLAAHNVSMNDPYFKVLYAKLRQQGKKHKQALGIVMSKLARVIFGMLKNGQAFDPGVDLLNQQKKQQAPKAEEKQKTKRQRRHQPQNEKAPVSSRQQKKRKQQIQKSRSKRPQVDKIKRTRSRAPASANLQKKFCVKLDN